MKQKKEKSSLKNCFSRHSFWLKLNSFFSLPFLFLIYLYQKFISPLFPPSCRFYPTCSEYSKQAFKKYGIFKGFFLSLKRILKCHPFHPGGYDPVP